MNFNSQETVFMEIIFRISGIAKSLPLKGAIHKPRGQFFGCSMSEIDLFYLYKRGQFCSYILILYKFENSQIVDLHFSHCVNFFLWKK